MSNNDCKNVLEGGLYFFDGEVMIIKKWDKDLNLDKDILSSIPTWIRLPDILIRLLEEDVLGRITNVVGKPIAMDNMTATQKRISYARILVEVEARKD